MLFKDENWHHGVSFLRFDRRFLRTLAALPYVDTATSTQSCIPTPSFSVTLSKNFTLAICFTKKRGMNEMGEECKRGMYLGFSHLQGGESVVY